MLMNFTLYAAHHSSPARPTSVYAKFFYNRMEELYQVGDLEKKVSLPVDFFFDRTTSNPYELEKGYIVLIVQPILNLWCKFLPELKEDLITKGLEENLKFLDKEREDAESKMKKTVVSESNINIRLLPEPAK